MCAVAAIKQTAEHGGLHECQTSWLPYRLLSWLIIAFAYAARRSEGSERARILSAKSRGNFLSEFILAYTAPGERFSFLAIRPTLTLDAMSSRN